MALLGTWWQSLQNNTISPVTGAAAIAAYAAYTHSLPTIPDLVLPVMRSISVVGNVFFAPGMLALPASASSASQVTIGYAVPSLASFPTMNFDIFAAYIHSVVR